MKKISSFLDLSLNKHILRAVDDQGYKTPTPVQVQAIPPLLDGRDLLGCAQTGTGKTAAFALPILELLNNKDRYQSNIRALILTPTRELAAQIDESFKNYGRYLKLKSTVIFGGVNQFSQVKALKRGIDILVATPGRLLDLMNQKIVNPGNLDIFVLDEADRMLDMGFIHDVRRIIAALPKERQSLFFSATIPPEVARLASSLLHKPIRVEVTPSATPVERIEQSLFFVDQKNKPKLLELLLKESDVLRALVFARTKHGAGRVAQTLKRHGVQADAIHGDRTQNARVRALEGFRLGKVRVLVATDIAARGIDVESVSHVINYDLPNVSETYVHRIGRTARAGADGVAFSFCSGLELNDLKAIEKMLGFQLRDGYENKYHSDDAQNGLVDGVPAFEVKKQREKERRQRILEYKESRNKQSNKRKYNSQKKKPRSPQNHPKNTRPNKNKPGRRFRSRG